MRNWAGNGGCPRTCRRIGLILACTLWPAAWGGPADAAAPAFDTTAKAADLRPTFASWGLPIRAQGSRGTCSVFAMVGAIEYALAHQQGKGTPLSVEFLNWASNRAIRDAQDGGYFSDLWKGFEAYGVCPETDMPYQTHFDAKTEPSATALERARQVRQASLRMHWIKRWNPKTGLTEGQFLQIKQTLQRQWPVCAGLRWPNQEHWKEGVLQMAPPEGVHDGHSVLLAGFRDDPAQPGGGVFLIRNSGNGLRDGAMSYEYARTYTNDAVWIDHGRGASTSPGAGPHRSQGHDARP